MKNRIYLTGFMGSGKSTVGPILANALGWNFFDLDKVIEDNVGKKISNIFDEMGEEYFRQIESKTLRELTGQENVIIALGGGTMANPANLNYLKKNGQIIYLKLSAESAYFRLRFKRDRPVLARIGTENMSKTEFIKKIKFLLDERIKYYEQADIIIDTDNVPVGITVDKIAKLILSD